MRFCETNPFVMLNKLHLCDSERMGYRVYRKMTNGFVFSEMTALFCVVLVWAKLLAWRQLRLVRVDWLAHADPSLGCFAGGPGYD